MSLRTLIYQAYSRKVYPRIGHLRGATRLKSILKELALQSLEKVDEEKAESISSKEWDNLIILDACRHDIYEEIMGCEVGSRITLGSRSPEFIEKTFSEDIWENTVLISSNPFYINFFPGDREGFFDLTGKTVNATFKEVYNLIETDWDEDQGVVLPERVSEKAIQVEEEYPNSRKIIHFMQPHTPHIPAEYDLGGVDHAIEEDKEKNTVWDAVNRGEIDEKAAVTGYKENLSYVIPYVQKLKESLSGKTVVTADHGEFLGEGGFYGHNHSGGVSKAVRKVPWDESS